MSGASEEGVDAARDVARTRSKEAMAATSEVGQCGARLPTETQQRKRKTNKPARGSAKQECEQRALVEEDGEVQRCNGVGKEDAFNTDETEEGGREDSVDIFDTSLSVLFSIPPIAFSTPSPASLHTYTPPPPAVLRGVEIGIDTAPIQLRLPQPPAELYTTLQAQNLWLSAVYLADAIFTASIRLCAAPCSSGPSGHHSCSSSSSDRHPPSSSSSSECHPPSFSTGHHPSPSASRRSSPSASRRSSPSASRRSSPSTRHHPTPSPELSRHHPPSEGRHRHRPIRVAELGAGAGLPGIAASRTGAQVVSSDWEVDEVLCVIQDNFRRSCPAGAWAVVGHRWGTDPAPMLRALTCGSAHAAFGSAAEPASASACDSSSEPGSDSLESNDKYRQRKNAASESVDAAGHEETGRPQTCPARTLEKEDTESGAKEDTEPGATEPTLEKFDALLLADVLWVTEAHAALLDSIFHLLKPGGTAHVAAGLHTGRGPVERFRLAAQKRKASVTPVVEVRWRPEGGWDEYARPCVGMEEERGVVVYFTLQVPT